MATKANLEDRKFVKLSAAAIHCGLSVTTLKKLIKAEELPAYRPAGKRSVLVVELAALDRMIKRRLA